MRVLWEKPGTWACPSCEGRQFKIVRITKDWIDYECLMCHQEDGILRNDFIKFIEEEVKDDCGEDRV